MQSEMVAGLNVESLVKKSDVRLFQSMIVLGQ